MLDTRYPRLLLLGVALLFIATGIGLKDPWPSDEPRFALVAQEMVDSGRWFFPTRGGELYPDKPPLFMWSQAIVLELTGSIRLASALPSLLSALVVLLIVFAAGQRFWNPRVGLLAGLLLLMTPQFVLEARAGQLDMMVTAWIALGFYGFLRHLRDGPDRRWLFVGFAACGFGVITKGVGFLPLLAFLAWPFLRPGTGRSPALLNVRDALVGVLCILGAIALWLIPMLLLVASSGDPAFEAYRDNILFKQTGERYVAPSHHFQPWWYFLGEVIPSLWFPVFVLLPWLVPAWRRAILGGNRTLPLVLAWAALVVLFFTLSPAKRGVYILPALPWICLAAATELDTLVARPGVRRLALAVGGIAATAGFALGVWLSFAEPERAAGLAARYGFNPTPVPWLVALGAGIATFVAWYRSTPVLAYAGTMLSVWLVLGLVIYPGINDYKSGRGLMLAVEEQLAPEQPLALVDWKEQTILQARRPVTNFGFLVPRDQQISDGVAWLNAHPQGRLLVQGRSMNPCFDREQAIVVGYANRRDWYLVSSSAVLPACDPMTPGRVQAGG